ncbi:PmoA family protein [Natronosporangium hydrolyticum]|uniref:PmoA family protein n=1 Tax=Natronosporangium hydrolyticum TaxID=2811111 RepID=A0A895YI94_9ACTN|nr:PmoA family protein [Natronosporangium hydrolyticum]QSB15772.1 PmoA family protein [Natronosporangium hydrolyticum]
MDSDRVRLRLRDRVVAEYQLAPALDPTLAPRPFLHPVRTLRGTVVTDALPDDHRWHLGASLTVADVAGNNLWGGRTYLRDTGYTWLADHGSIQHREFLTERDDHLVARLQWLGHDGDLLLDEQRELRARLVPGHPDAWALEVSYTLTAPAGREITLGSPATNGRPGPCGYGGFFWRAAAGDAPPEVFSAAAAGEAAVNGSTADWVGLRSAGPDPYTLIFAGLGPGDHWFVRAAGYPGVCAAFAFRHPRTIPAGGTLRGRHTVVVADGRVSQPPPGTVPEVD